jgi:hypothetical protein
MTVPQSPKPIDAAAAPGVAETTFRLCALQGAIKRGFLRRMAAAFGSDNATILQRLRLSGVL